MGGEIFTKNKIIKLDNINSTNEFATNLVKKDETEGTVVWANFQTNGKGQKGNVWESEDGKNLTFSIILYPFRIEPSQQFLLNKAISLGIIDFLKTKIDKSLVKIKWPNDIYVGNHKIAGVLIENEILGVNLQSSIVGIGLNVNQLVFSANIPNPTSLSLVTGIDFNIEEVLLQLLNKIEARIINLYNNDIDLINNDYLNNLLHYKIDKKYIVKNVEIQAMIIDISEYGQLILKIVNKKIIKCDFKEIIFLHDKQIS